MLYPALIAAALLTSQFVNESLAQAPALVLPPSTAQQDHATSIQPDSTYAIGRAAKLTIFVANSPAPIKARKLLILGSPTRPKTTKTPKSSYAELTAKNLEVPHSLINEDRRNHVVHDNTLTRPTDIEYTRLDPTRGFTNSAGALTTP